MLAHGFFILRRARLRAVQDLFPDLHFANVVQHRGHADGTAHLLRQGVSLGLLHQMVQQHSGQGADVLHMGAALAVAALHHPAQNADHHLAALFLLRHLIRHHGAQAALLCIHADGVGNALIHHPCIKGAADIIGRTQIKGAAHRVHIVLAGDHDDRDLFQHSALAHGFQHGKAVNAGHVDIQQHNGDAGGVLFQQAQAVLAGSRFGSVELAVQHLAEQHPVHGRVVHNEHTLAAVGRLQGVRLRLTLGDHGVFLDACIVHQPFRVLHRIVHIFVVDPHAANAGRHADAGVARHAGRLQLQTDLFQTRAELFLPDVRQQQKQPAAVVADQAVFFRKAAPDGAYRRFQHAVARTGAVNIVGELQIVHIQHRYTGGNAAVAVVLIIIGAVVGTGQRVAVALFPLVGNTVEQPLTVFRVQQNAAVDLAGQLQHTELAIHLHTAGRDLVQLLPKVFQPCFPGVLFQRLPCHAVFTRTAAPPLGIAGRAALFAALHLVRLHQAHRHEHLAELAHFLFHLLACSVFFAHHRISPAAKPRVLGRTAFLHE